MRILYDAGILLYHLAIRIAALWNPKARLWVAGRKQVFANLSGRPAGNTSKRIWMHCASLGEFEQGRPLLEALRNAYPDAFILLTFFSPSGYEIRKHYPLASQVSYLPMDGALRSRRFVRQVQPDLAIFIKYEFWYHYLQALKGAGVPTLLVSAIFRPSQPFFKPWGGFWRNMLRCYAGIFVQDQRSAELLAGAGVADRTRVSGDTRFDRVLDVSRDGSPLPRIEAFCGSATVIVAGSTWPEDEEVLAHFARSNPSIRFIIAPHEIDEDHLAEIEKRYPASIRFSTLPESGMPSTDEQHVLLMDNMGMLSKLYRYAQLTYVGGGFGGAGIHNILEAAVYGKPVIFGPVHQKSREALELQARGGAFSIQSAVEFEDLAESLLGDAGALERACQASAAYVREQAGATGKIMQWIQENRLLIS